MKCENGCGKESIYITKRGRHICAKSGNSCPAVKERKKLSYLKKYGVENPQQSKEIKDKTKKTNLDRYGSEYIVISKDFNKKSKKTLMENYGVEYNMQSDIIQNNRRKKSLDIYGVDHQSKREDIKDKKRQTSLKRYGVESYFQTDEFREKYIKTMLDRYGVENPMHDKKIREKCIKAAISSYYKKGIGISSNGEQRWLDSHNIDIKNRQKVIECNSGKIYSVDALVDNTVYEYLGVFWHGHPKYFDHEKINTVVDISFGELYIKTTQRINDIIDTGYEIIVVWEDGTNFTGNEIHET